MINNFEHIIPFLNFRTEDDFYHLQVLKRKKENPELGSNSRVIKTYYVTSVEYLEDNMEEIKLLCDFHNARGCINLNRRSFEKVAKHVHLKIAHQILMNEDYFSVRKSYESVCGGVQSDKGTVSFGGILAETKGGRKWVVDIDVVDSDYLMEVGNYISTLEPHDGKEKILTSIRTPNGYHIISHPFRLDEFKRTYPEIDVHKNNPTILYTS